jgi:hypothetical protein
MGLERVWNALECTGMGLERSEMTLEWVWNGLERVWNGLEWVWNALEWVWNGLERVWNGLEWVWNGLERVWNGSGTGLERSGMELHTRILISANRCDGECIGGHCSVVTANRRLRKKTLKWHYSRPL